MPEETTDEQQTTEPEQETESAEPNAGGYQTATEAKQDIFGEFMGVEGGLDEAVGDTRTAEQQGLFGDPLEPESEPHAPDETETSGAAEEQEPDESETETKEDPEAEAGAGEPDPDTDSDEETGERPEILDQIARRTGHEYDDVDTVADHIDNLETTVAGFQALESVMTENEEVARFIEGIAQGLPAERAAAKAIPGVQTEAPDPEESPEEYAEWLAERRAAEKQQSEQSEKEQKLQKRREAIQQRSRQLLDNFAEKKEWSEEEKTRFAKEVNNLVFGDVQTGTVRGDLWERMHFALNKEEIENAAYQQGKKDGRNEAIEQYKKGNFDETDGVPFVAGSGGGAPDQSGRQPTEQDRHIDILTSKQRRSADQDRFIETGQVP